MSSVVTYPNGTIAVIFAQPNNSIIACSTDSDCPGAAVCSIDPTWPSARPGGMCTCYLNDALTGADCNELTPASIGIIVGYSVSIVLAAYSILLLANLFYLLRVQLKLTKITPLVLTIVFCLVAAIFLFIYLTIEVATLSHTSTAILPSGTKDTSVATFQDACLVVALFFFVLNIMQVSLVWIDSARAADRMQVSTQNRAHRGLYAFYAVYLIAVIVSLIFDSFVGIAIVLIIMIAIIVFTYVLGYLNLTRILTASMELTQQRKNVTTEKILRTIRRTMLLIAIWASLFFILLILYIGIGINGATPYVPTGNIIAPIMYFSALNMNLVVVHNAQSSVRAKLQGLPPSAHSAAHPVNNTSLLSFSPKPSLMYSTQVDV